MTEEVTHSNAAAISRSASAQAALPGATSSTCPVASTRCSVAASPAAVACSTYDVPSRSGTMRSPRSEEHTSELQSLMRISYDGFCLKKKISKHNNKIQRLHTDH